MQGPMGGTEIALQQLRAQLGNYPMGNIAVMSNYCNPAAVREGRINILWQQLSYDLPMVQNMRNRDFVDAVDYFVYVSHWQYNKFREHFKIPENRSFVIKNATFFRYRPKSSGRAKYGLSIPRRHGAALRYC